MNNQKKLSYAFLPNVVYVADYLSQCGFEQMVRFQILALEEGGFEVQKIDSAQNNMAKKYQPVAKLSSLSLAKGRVQEEGYAIEQNGFDFYEEADYPLYDCTAEIVQHGICEPANSVEFHAQHHCSKDLIVQPLSGGFHGIVTVNQYGHIYLTALGSDNKTRLLDCSEARQIMGLMAIAGSRGAILEVVISNSEVMILDATYFADRWLDDLPFSQRIGFILNKLKLHGISTQMIIKPRIVEPIELLRLNAEGRVKGLMVRKINSRPIIARGASLRAFASQWVVTAGQATPVKLVTAIKEKTNVLCGNTLEFLHELDLPAYICQAYRDVAFLAQCSNPNRSPIVLNIGI